MLVAYFQDRRLVGVARYSYRIRSALLPQQLYVSFFWHSDGARFQLERHKW